MTDGDPKSMDDVLASIRRIVRAEKESGVATGPGDAPHEETRRRAEADEPLVLTPEMRIDAAGAGAEPAADATDPSAGPGDAGLSAVPGPADREELRAVLREVLREELSAGPAAEAVRGIMRDELTSGQVGRNISQNVLRLIRDEVARAVQPPR